MTKGFVSFFDLIYVWGANSTQLPSTSTITSGNFQYRNYLMGLNQINIATTTQNVDIVLQVTPSQIFFTFNFLLGSAAMPTF